MKRLHKALLVCLILSLISTTLCHAESGAHNNVINGVWIDFSTATDEELADALKSIQNEQRARMKTKIVLNAFKVSIAKGKNFKLTAEIQDVPEGVKAEKVTWNSSDNKIASCQQGTIQGIKNGSAVITASSKLSDGTVLSAECVVTVYTAVTGLSAKTKKFELGVGNAQDWVVECQPKDASNQTLKYTSSDTSVATVNSQGQITGLGIGKATITATTTDGSEKSMQAQVTVSKKDDTGVKKTDSDGVSVTLVGYKETKGSSYARPESGNIFVLVEFLIENNSREEVAISSIMSFTGYCDGYTCSYSFSATMNTSKQMDGTIMPGKKMKGQVGFEIPNNWKELEVHVTPDYWGGEDLEFVIYHK